MSVPPKGEELQEKGEKLHLARGRPDHAEFAQAVAKALKKELAGGASVKTIMAWTDAGERTVKGWLTGANAPRGVHLDALFRSSEAVYGLMMLRAGRRPVVTQEGLKALREQLSGLVGEIDMVLST